MEIVLSLAVGVLVACGVWLILRPRTFQVIIGLALISYGVNLFIFSMGRPRIGAAPILKVGGPQARHARKRGRDAVDADTLRAYTRQPLQPVKPQQPLDIGLFERRLPEAPHIVVPDE